MQDNSPEALFAEVTSYGNRVLMIEAVNRFITDKTPNGLGIETVRFEGKYRELLAKNEKFKAALDVFSNDNVGTFLTGVKRIKELQKTKWSELPNKLKNWTDAARAVCSEEQIPDGRGSKKTIEAVGTSFSMTRNPSHVATMDDLKGLGFEVETIEAALQVNGEGECKRSSSGLRDRARNLKWEEYLRTFNLSIERIKTELAPVQALLNFLSKSGPHDFIAKWNDKPITGLDRTVGEVVMRLCASERLLSSVTIDDTVINAVTTAYSDEALASMIAAAETTEAVRLIVDTASELQKMSFEKDKKLADELGKAISALKNKAEGVRFGQSPAEQVRTMRDIHGLMVTVTKLLRGVEGAVGKSMASGKPLMSLFASGVSPGIIRPLDTTHLSSFKSEVKPQTARLEMYSIMMSQHLAGVASDPIVRDVTTLASNTTILIDEINKSISNPNCNRSAVRASVMSAMKMYMRNVRRSTQQFAGRITEFMVWSNRKPFEYVVRWAAVYESSPESLDAADVNHITKYFEQMKAAGEAMNTAMQKVEEIALKMLADSKIASILSSDEVIMEDAQRMVENFEEFFMTIRKKLNRLYSFEGGFGMLDLLRDPTFLIMYLLKGFRVFIIWASLRFAKSIFVPFYNNSVYAQNKAPPNPMWFVGIFLAIDLGFNIALYVILATLQFIFKKDGFPVTDRVMRAVLTDYLVSTIIIGVLALVIANVVKSKKYFRYRFEGDRGIRALKDMIMWTSPAILCVPYFRFADG